MHDTLVAALHVLEAPYAIHLSTYSNAWRGALPASASAHSCFCLLQRWGQMSLQQCQALVCNLRLHNPLKPEDGVSGRAVVQTPSFRLPRIV